MKTQRVTRMEVIVRPDNHEAMQVDGFSVVVRLNGYDTVSTFFTQQADAEKKRAKIAARKIPAKAELGLVAGVWVPLTSCNPIFAI